MERKPDTLEDIKKRLGIDQLPEPRYEMATPNRDPSTVKLWKALQLVDAIETAAFERYIPSKIIIDQSINSYSLTVSNTFGAAVRTDVPIPSHVKIEKATGIGTAPHAHNHYNWLAQKLGQHWDELGPVGCSSPLVWRTYGGRGEKPLVGLIFHLSFLPGNRLDVGANWAVLTPKTNESTDSF